MGRGAYSKKDTVEDYHAISIKRLTKLGYLLGRVGERGRCISNGTLRWTRGGEPSGSVGVSFDLILGSHGTMHLNYTNTDHFSAEKVELSYPVQLVTTPCHYGGVRWWFLCPITKRGIPCSKRVGVLYLGKFAGCRDCHNLTYSSCQDSHKFDRMAIGMGCDPSAFSRMMNRIGKD